MTEDDDNIENPGPVNILDKIDILLTLIENGPSGKYKALSAVLEEARFELLHAWNEIKYYRELCEGYETAINKIGSELN